jgi:hypothetical protein
VIEAITPEKGAKLARFGVLCFLIAWVVGIFGFLAPPIGDRHAFAFATPNGTAVSDFVHFYQCGAMTLSADRGRVYDAALQQAVTNELIAPEKITRPFYIQYVPFIFPLLAPLALMPIEIAYTVWFFLSVGVGTACLFLLLRTNSALSNFDRALFAMYVLSSCPGVIALKLGQSSWFLLACFCCVYLWWQRSRDILAGCALALTTIKPQYIVLFVISLVSARRWKILAGFGLALCGLALLAVFTIGWQNVIYYPAILFHAETSTELAGVEAGGMISLRGVLSQFLPQIMALPISIAVLLGGAVAAYRLWSNESKSNWAMALTVVLCLVVSPHTHIYDLLLLSVAAAVTLATISPIQACRLTSVPERVWTLLMLVYPIITWGAYMSLQTWILTIMNVALLVAGGLHWQAIKSPRD